MSNARRVSARQTSRPSRSLPKVLSGVAGLDEILPGGLLQGRRTLVSGRPGAGKTVLGPASLYRAARGSKHSNSCHVYVITDRGIRVRAMPSETNRGMIRSNRRREYGTLGTAGIME